MVGYRRWADGYEKVETTNKRPIAAILADLRDVDCQLSPENLCADGERSAPEVLRLGNQLHKQRVALVAELGREPTFTELFGVPQDRVPVPGPSNPVTLQRLDRVRLSSGQILIVTGFHPNRPSNCWSGVLEKGFGKEYVFGPKHRPVKLGAVSEDHPALLSQQQRRQHRAGGMLTLAGLEPLFRAGEVGDLVGARRLIEGLRLSR